MNTNQSQPNHKQDNLEEVKKFLKEKTEEIEKIQTKLNKSYWNATISGKKENYIIYEKICVEFANLLNSRKDFAKVKKFMLAKTNDKLTKRQLEILHNYYLSFSRRHKSNKRNCKKSNRN